MLFGRDALRRRVEGWLEDGEPLLTLHGPPGVGKSALLGALAADDRIAISLEGARDGVAVDRAVAVALGVGGSGRLDERLADAFATRAPTVLLLDEVEDAVDALRARLPRWCAAAPGWGFVIASQIVLQIPEERRVPVPPLDAEHAAALFRDRLDRLAVPRPAAELEVALLTRLEGLPLALELAAARAAALPPRDLLAVLDDRLASLREPRGGRSLTAALDAALAPLDAPLRATLARLALFGAPIDLPLATVACGGDGQAAEAHLHALFERSLLLRDAEAFRMLAVVRERALASLDDRAAIEAALARGLAARAAVLADAPWGPAREVDRRALARLRPALEAAATWAGAVPSDRARLRVAVAVHDEARLPAAERRRFLEREAPTGADRGAAAAHRVLLARARLADADPAAALEAAEGAADEPSMEAPLALVEAAAATLTRGDVGEALARAERAADAAPPRHRHRVRAEAAYLRFHLDGDPAPARAALDEARDALTTLDDAPGAARAATLRGLVAVDTGELPRAAHLFEAALAEARAFDPRAPARLAEHGLALALHELGDLDAAAERYAAAMQQAREAGTRRAESYVEGFLAALEVERGRPGAAARRLRRVVATLERLGDARQADLFGALLALLEGRPAGPDRAAEGRDAAERAARELLAAMARAVAAGEDPARARDAFRAELGAERDWMLRFALRLPERLAAEDAGDGRGLAWRDGRFRLDEGAWVDLSRRSALRRIVDALVAADGARLSREAIFAAGWPDEPRTAASSAAQRVHTAVRRLRRLGLGDALASDREGYWIDRPIVTAGSPRR